MSQTHDDVRALRVVVDELRAEPPPELAWDAIEARLFAQIDARPATAVRRAPPSSSPLVRAFAFAAAAAAIVLGITSFSRSDRMRSSAPAHLRRVEATAIALVPGATGVHDLSALSPGDVVETSDAPLRFGQAGLVTWTLAPRSALRVRTVGVGHTVALERGALRAEVTPRDPSEGLVEAFAVEVAGTRIAVHGTEFSVRIDGKQAIVDVEHGAVAVGPIGYGGATTGHLLVGPSCASFSLDGGRSARFLDHAEESRAHAALWADARMPAVTAALEPPAREPAAITADPRSAPAHDEEPAARDERVAAAPAIRAPIAAHAARPAHDEAQPAAPRAPEPARLSVGQVRARLDACFKQTYEAGSSGVRVSVASTLRIDVNPDGSVRSARFDPPLKPELQVCAGSAIAGRFADDAGHIDIPVSFER